MRNGKVAILGECMIEIQRSPEGMRQGFGGDTLNTAVYMARLAEQDKSDTSIDYFTALGCDSLSEEMLQAWKGEGVNTHYVAQYEDKRPGLYLIENSADGEREFHYWRNDSAARQWLARESIDSLYEQLKDHDLIYLSGITLAIQEAGHFNQLMVLLERLKKNGCLIAFDSNYRPNLWVTSAQTKQRYELLYRLTDIALLTLDDEQMLYGDANTGETIDRLATFGISQVILKMGGEGCLVCSGGKSQLVETTPAEGVVDTTAAGDSFNAAYLYQWLKSKDCYAAAKAGHRLAGEVIRHRGAIIDKQHMPESV